MKKVFFLTNTVDLTSSSDGLAKKIHSQVKAFQECGYITELAGCSGKFYKIEDHQFSIEETGVFSKTNEMLKLLEEYILKQENYEILYIRKFYFTPYFLNFLKNIRPKFKKIVLELPTYPYYGEIQTVKGKIAFWIEYLLVIRKISKYIDKIITFSNDKKIYGINCIKISNGIDSSEQVYSEEPDRNIMNFISVSSISFWHGIDRFILALKNYEGNNVHFHIVGGENNISLSLKKMVQDYNLIKKVTFHGQKSGEELQKIYAMCHIGVGSLGRHRSNVYHLNSLKNREYLAKGIPIIYSEFDNDLDNLDFVFKLSPDENAIDLDEIIQWYINGNFSKKIIHDFSDRFLWINQINKILRFL